MKKKLSLRAQVVLVSICFVALILGLIFVFQTFFLNGFYKTNKIQIIKRTAETIAENIASEDLDESLESVSLENDVCVMVISDAIYENNNGQNNVCALTRLSPMQISEIAYEVQANNNEKLFDDFHVMAPVRDDIYIFGKLINHNENPTLILVSSIVTPLGATLKTIQNQYVGIVVIVILATILLALILSRVLIKPIKDINEEAKSLPKGKYNGDLVKTNNKEVEDLNLTLKEANEEILQAEKAKKELLANVSHDLRTPLTMIVGYGEMIRDLEDENPKENAEIIIEEAKRLSALVDDLIDVSRFENNNFKLKKEKISLNTLLESVYKQYEKYCENQNVKFELKTIKDLKVELDENRIKQVLYNFINNALNYNDKDNKEITLGVEKSQDFYRVYVLDNGQGIDKKNLDKVWDRYYKVDKEHRRAHLGSGIGLSLSRDILEASNLKYGVESKKGEYSKFYFEIHK